MRKFNITVNGNVYEVDVEEIVNGAPVAAPVVSAPAAAPAAAPAPAAPKAAPVASGSEGSVKIEAPMPGTVLKVNVKVGDKVSAGDAVVILEAMKMENEIAAPSDGVVASVNVSQGASVDTGALLITLN